MGYREGGNFAGVVRGLTVFFGLPDVEELGVAGGGDGEVMLSGGAAEGGADVFLGVGELGEGNFERGAFFELVDVLEKLRDDEFVLAVAPLGDVGL